MSKKKIRIKVGEKIDFGTGRYCKKQLEQLSLAFQPERLERYGLERSAATFDDLMTGGVLAIEQYRQRLEKELPVDSALPYIAERAREEVDEAIDELRRFVNSVQSAGKVNNSHAMLLKPEYVRYDEETDCVVLTSQGQEVLEEELFYFIRTMEQLDIFNLANEVKQKYEELGELVRKHSAVLNVRDVLEMDSTGVLNVEVEKIVQI